MKRLFLVLLAMLMLAGCESTRFESPPVKATYDDEILGRWVSIGDTPGERGEVELRITHRAGAHEDSPEGGGFEVWDELVFVENKKEGTTKGKPTDLNVGRDGDRRYAWVDARWAEERMGQPPRADKGDVLLYRYRIDGDRLDIWQPDTQAIAHRVIDNKLKGDVVQANDELHVRLKAPVQKEALRMRYFWSEDVLHFERAPVAADDE
jgi:hypothetical protein